MKIPCKVQIVSPRMSTLPLKLRKKPCKSTLALCKHPKNDQEFFLLLFNDENKNGTKYTLKNNLKQILTKFANEGKFTVQLKNPEQDLCVQGDVIQIKGFLHLLRRALEGQLSPRELSMSSNMSVTPVKDAPTKLVINKRSDYPSKGFPRTLESLSINDIGRHGLDKGILQLQKLKILNLSNNLIEFLPKDLDKLSNLKELNMSHNSMGKATLQQWQWLGSNSLSKSLTNLDLSYNNLTFLPNQFFKMQNLTTLNLNNNNLELLPAGIGMLKNLRIFSAKCNKLTMLPGSMKKLHLQFIDVSENNFPQNIPLSCTIHNLPVCSLKEYAAKKVLSAKIPYSADTLPLNLIDYLDYANYCVCGKPCFSTAFRKTCNFALTDISASVNTMSNETVYVPLDCYFCHVKCLLDNFIRVRRPIHR